MSRDIRTHAELADFLERLLRDQMYDGWEIDDFESLPIAKKKSDEKWILELWRHCILDIAGAKNPPQGRWMHSDARPYIEKIMEALRYIDKAMEEKS